MLIGIAAFHEVDYKGEGKLDRDTVGDLLDQLGIHITDRVNATYLIIISNFCNIDYEPIVFSASMIYSLSLTPMTTEASI